MPPVGFVLLTHANPGQIIRLVRRLNHLYDTPPIVCHHDFGKCDLPAADVPGSVAFVRPHLPTRWGDFSLVEATVRALGLMCGRADCPDWVVILSGSDYPIKPAADVVRALNAGGYDAHIHHELIEPGRFERPWQELCHHRFYAKTFRLARWHFTTRNPWLTRWFLPFSRHFRCYAGSQWFSLSAAAARYVVEFHRTRPALARHYRTVAVADESYFHTVLANAPHLRLHNDNFRYTDWSAGQPHPKTLTAADLPALLESPAHFARKFDPAADGRVLDELDAATG